MKSQQEIQTLLIDLLGSANVYFQAPPNNEMAYPCILYKLDAIRTRHADNEIYRDNRAYSVTAIDRNPNSSIPNNLLALPKSRFDRFYTADKLNHFVFTIFF